jgi:hypothetical protein
MEDELDHELLSEAETAWAQREWSIQHVLFPSMRLFLKPPTSMATNGTFVQVRIQGPDSMPFSFYFCFCFLLLIFSFIPNGTCKMTWF